MKSSMLFAAGLVAAWVAFTPAPCRAQFEIAPDHFEMINVEPITQITKTIAANGDPGKRQIPDEGRGGNNHGRASFKASGKDGYFQFVAFGFSIAVEACKYVATQPSKPVSAIERIRKQARFTLNYFSFSREATLLRETLNPTPEWPTGPLSCSNS